MLTNLTKIRKSRGLRQYEVAKHLNIDRASYSNYETGKRDPDTDTVVKLANLFDVTTDYLLGKSDDPTPPNKDKFDNKALIYQRKHAKHSPESMALFMGIPEETYQAYEKGTKQPAAETVEWLANFLECTVDYLMGRSDLPLGYVKPVIDLKLSAQKKEAPATEAEAKLLKLYSRADSRDKMLIDTILQKYDDDVQTHEFAARDGYKTVELTAEQRKEMADSAERAKGDDLHDTI